MNEYNKIWLPPFSLQLLSCPSQHVPSLLHVFLNQNKFKNYSTCMGCFAWMYVWAPHVCLVTEKTRRGFHIPWNWKYIWLWAVIWLLGTEPRTSWRAISALNHKAISPAPTPISDNSVGPVRAAHMCMDVRPSTGVGEPTSGPSAASSQHLSPANSFSVRGGAWTASPHQFWSSSWV